VVQISLVLPEKKLKNVPKHMDNAKLTTKMDKNLLGS
jgi:hypothetical protein